MDPGCQAALALSGASRRSRWAIVLAGGQGLRMKSLVADFIGDGIPKQFCTFMGTRSMLQHTLDRAGAIVPPEQVITIICKEQRALFDMAVDDYKGRLIEQPVDRGTAAAIYLALAQILGRDPLATVIILPSTHFIFPEERFVGHALNSMVLAQNHPGSLIQIGAYAQQPRAHCGWIQPDKREWSSFWCNPGSTTMEIVSFREDPSEAESALLYRWGWLLNTMIVSARVQTLWNLGWEFVPQVMQRVTHQRNSAGERLASMPVRDFGVNLLQQATHRTRVLPMTDVYWNAWDHPQNIGESLKSVGMKQPSHLTRHIASLSTKSFLETKAVPIIHRNTSGHFRGQGFRPNFRPDYPQI